MTPQPVDSMSELRNDELTSRIDQTALISANKCKSLVPRYSSPSRMVKAIAVVALATALLIAPLINCQTHDNDCKHRQRSQAARQQRQFNNNQKLNLNQAPGGQQQVQHQQQQQQQLAQHINHHRSTESEHEEFSLALGSTNGQQVAHSNYTLLPTQSSGELPTGNGGGGTSSTVQTNSLKDPLELVSNTTPALPNDSIGSPVALQPSVTTSSTIVATSASSNSIGGSRNQMASPPSSTTMDPQNMTNLSPTAQPQSSDQADELMKDSLSSINKQPQQQQQQPSNQRQNEELMARSSGSGAKFANNEDYRGAQARHEDGFGSSSSQVASMRHMSLSNLPQPVSSSPSSISIITPLIGPPTAPAQQQTHTASVSASIGGGQDSQSSSSMMKPIFVVGNPISERDYNGPFQYSDSQSQLQSQQHQQQQHYHTQQQTPGELTQVSLKAPKSVESSSVAPITQPEQHSQQPKTVTANNFAHNQHLPGPSSRIDKSSESTSGEQVGTSSTEPAQSPPNTVGMGHLNQMGADRMGGPPLVYSDGHLAAVGSIEQQQAAQQQTAQMQTGNGTNLVGPSGLPPPSPRLFQVPSNPNAAVVGNNPRRPSLPPPVNQANAASGFRSPLSPSGPLLGGASTTVQSGGSLPMSATSNSMSSLQPPINSAQASFYQTSPPYAGASNMNLMGFNPGQAQAPTMITGYNKPAFVLSQAGLTEKQQQQVGTAQSIGMPQAQVPTPLPGTAPGSGRRPLNITRVEHISAECSNDLIRAVIVFNGTFKGIIYSSGYVSDPTCLYVNGTGSTRYEFSIRLNQCGTLGRQELHQPTIPGEARRRDQVMWNTLSIQYNSIIEQEWDEHFRVSCEYGSDFWKTVSFSPFNVETNTGSPVVFTINPPQCQMDVLLGHGMGPKIAVDGPVTVGDPLTLLIHMKSEKAGYDILVKNCVAHNGGKQRMQLIDSNGCVVNERFISPFRGTYNDNDLRHVTLYAYLKAFRFTGSPVLYLECEIHMCQSACPPQMCYWRRLSKRSVDNFEYEYTTNSSLAKLGDEQQPLISDSLNLFKALQVIPEPTKARHQMSEIYAEDDEAALICYRHTEVCIFLTTIASLLALVITIAITCCLRIRKLTKSQFEHSRLTAASSLSPSLLSISDAISSVGSLGPLPTLLPIRPSGNKTNNHQSPQSPWNLQHSSGSNCNNNNNLSKQQRPMKPTMYLQRQPVPPISTFQGKSYACSPQAAR